MLEVQLFFDDDDRHEKLPMQEYILRYLMRHNIRGATLFAARGGYGAKRHLQLPSALGTADEGPLMILFVDTEERVRAVLPHLRTVLPHGLITTRTVEILDEAEQSK